MITLQHGANTSTVKKIIVMAAVQTPRCIPLPLFFSSKSTLVFHPQLGRDDFELFVFFDLVWCFLTTKRRNVHLWLIVSASWAVNEGGNSAEIDPRGEARVWRISSEIFSDSLMWGETKYRLLSDIDVFWHHFKISAKLNRRLSLCWVIRHMWPFALFPWTHH